MAVVVGVVAMLERPIVAVAAAVAEVEAVVVVVVATRHPPPNAAAILARRVGHENDSAVVAEEEDVVADVEVGVAARAGEVAVRKMKRNQPVPRSSMRPWMNIG